MAADPGLRRLLAAAGVLSRWVELTATRLHPQEDYQCGLATLAMGLGAAGLPTPPEQLARQIFERT